MQLLFRRSLQTGPRLRFVLWAKFEIDADEERLINKYSASQAYITIEHSRRDLYRAFIFAFFVALVGGNFALGAGFGFIGSAVLFWIIFLVGAGLIYEQLREAIKIADLLTGRDFKNRSLALLVRRERRMVGYAVAFTQMLKAMETWEGTEVIQIGPEHEPALRLVTDTYAPT